MPLFRCVPVVVVVQLPCDLRHSNYPLVGDIVAGCHILMGVGYRQVLIDILGILPVGEHYLGPAGVDCMQSLE